MYFKLSPHVKYPWHEDLWLISSTFYVPIFLNECRFGSFFYIHVTREKLRKRLSYEKFVPKTLMKLKPSVGSIADASLLALCQRTITLSFQRRISVTVTDGDISMALSLSLSSYNSWKARDNFWCFFLFRTKKGFQSQLRCKWLERKNFNKIDWNILSYKTMNFLKSISSRICPK